jgi:hypothetical protein
MTGRSVIPADEDHPGHARSTVAVQLLHVPDCPLVDGVRASLRSCLAKASVEASIEEIEGSYPSPTLLIEGIDVTGHRPAPGASCRLDLPTEEQILAALAGLGS